MERLLSFRQKADASGETPNVHPEKDPVCRMDLEAWDDRYEVTLSGKTYHFCSSECKQTFQLFPDKFLSGGWQAQSA